MSVDARVRYTKKVLRDALFECLKEKDLQSITIKELCERAEINRATFYKHYRDCYDLVDQLAEELEEDFKQLLMNSDIFSIELMDSILELLEKNKDIRDALVNGKISERLRIGMMDMARENCLGNWKKKLTHLSSLEVEMLFGAVSAAVFQLAVMDSDKYDKKAIVDFTHRMTNGFVRQFS